MKNFFASFALVARENYKLDKTVVAYDRKNHRPGVLFPYLDNDIASYPYLDEFIQYSFEELGAKVRIASVGYSSNNQVLQEMHENIANNWGHAIEGLRFSFTPYTLGWTKAGERVDQTSRKQFMNDYSNFLHTYKPLLLTIKTGKTRMCAELRFRPMIYTTHDEIIASRVQDHHVIGINKHLLVSKHPHVEPVDCRITDIKDGISVFSEAPVPYSHFVVGEKLSIDTYQKIVLRILNKKTDGIHSLGIRDVYKFTNCDGYYYAVDPSFSEDGHFSALHIYPKTASRSISDYIDTTRFFLNTLLDYKADRGLQRRDKFPNSTIDDIQNVLAQLKRRSEDIRAYDTLLAQHIEDEILPIVSEFTAALLNADYPPSIFFDSGFTVDTGQIVNQGRALSLFRKLVTKEDEPITPHEERGYGAVSLSTIRGNVWRIVPVPFGTHNQDKSGIRGGKNKMNEKGLLQIQELEPRYLRPIREYQIEGVELEHVELSEAKSKFLYPGIVQQLVERPRLFTLQRI